MSQREVFFKVISGKKSYGGFTLVELIVVITILVILGTIAFVSLSGFSGSARDSSRVSDLSLIGKGLDIHYTKLWSFPSPTSSTGITFGSSSSVVWYQGTIGEWVIRFLGWAWARISTKPVDPLSKEEYRYSLPTGVNEYLLGADYEGDSVAYARIPHLASPNLGEELSFSPPMVGGARGGTSATATKLFSFLDPLMKGVTNGESRGIFGLNPEDSASASTGSPTISYLKGTYNGVATRVSSGSTINIIALPSIFLSSGSTGTIVDASSRNFLLQGKSLSWVSFAPKVVYSSGALPSNDTERLLFSSGIVAAYSGTSLTSNSDIKSFIDNVNSTGSLSAIGGNFVRNKFGGNGPTVVVATAPASSASVNITNSLMFNGTSNYLSRTMSGAGDQKRFTLSTWIKRSKLNAGHRSELMYTTTGGWSYIALDDNGGWGTTDKVAIGLSSGNTVLTIPDLLRDPSAWYHLVVSVDTTQTGATDRIRIYLNGVERSTSLLLGSSYPTKDSNTEFNGATQHQIGWSWWTNYMDGYLADYYWIDGQQLAAGDFGQLDSSTGQWKPKQFTGNYGTNGFHLDFSSGATVQSLGADSAPISGGHTVKNDWTVNGMSVAGNQMIDSPTNNFATLNPLDSDNGSTGISASTGNTTATSGADSAIRSTFFFDIADTNGYYWEVSGVSGLGNSSVYGIATNNSNLNTIQTNWGRWWYINCRATTGTCDMGGKLTDTTRTDAFASFTNGDVIGLYAHAWQLDVYKSGALQGVVATGLTGYFSPFIGEYNAPAAKATINFGQGGQDFSSGNRGPSAPYSDAGGVGKFRYQPPANAKALSTANLPDPAISNPKQFFDVLTYTGNGSSQSMTGLSFQPDLVWLKDRTSGNNHGLWDSMRLATKYLMSNSGASEVTDASSLTSFLSNGFSLGSNAWWNTNGNRYVGWNWKAGWDAAVNTNWSIASQVSANQGAGFSIVTYTGNGVSATVWHGLGSIPQLMIVKPRTTAQNWITYHAGMATLPQNGYLTLDTASNYSAYNMWNNTSPTSSVFSLSSAGYVNQSGVNYVAYLWSEVPWFSKFGSYVGNNSMDWPFVYTGFKPRWILYKAAWSAVNGNWRIIDTSRSSYNEAKNMLFPNLPDAEVPESYGMDVLGNGFKIRRDNVMNDVGITYIYAAFAETPFKYATAR